jgi:ubiquinone/menaquinone biosynthesis C-methylase UbiE
MQDEAAPAMKGHPWFAATEPDPYMLRRARKRARELALDVRLHRAPAEALSFPDDSFDTIVSTLVLCTVTDQQRALGEIRRALKPGGTLRLVEHVRADGRLGRFQHLVVPIWRRLGAGCHPNRRTAASVEAAGFAIVDLERRPLPLAPLIAGVASPGTGTAS